MPSGRSAIESCAAERAVRPGDRAGRAAGPRRQRRRSRCRSGAVDEDRHQVLARRRCVADELPLLERADRERRIVRRCVGRGRRRWIAAATAEHRVADTIARTRGHMAADPITPARGKAMIVCAAMRSAPCLVLSSSCRLLRRCLRPRRRSRSSSDIPRDQAVSAAARAPVLPQAGRPPARSSRPIRAATDAGTEWGESWVTARYEKRAARRAPALRALHRRQPRDRALEPARRRPREASARRGRRHAPRSRRAAARARHAHA